MIQRFREQARRGLQLWEILRPDLAGQGPRLSLGALLGALFVAGRLAQPWPLKWIFDDLGGGSSVAALAALYLAITAAGALADFGQRVVLLGVANHALAGLRLRLFERVLGHSLSFHERHPAAEVLTRVVYDTSRLRRGLQGVLLRSFQNVFHFGGVIVVLAVLNLTLAAVALACGGTALVTMLVTGRRIRRVAARLRRKEGRLASLVADRLAGIRELQAYGAGPDARFDDFNRKSFGREQKLRRMEAALILRVEVLLAVGVCLVLWLALRPGAAPLTTGTLVLFVHYMITLYRPLTQFARQTSQTGRALACAGRLVQIMNHPVEVADRPGAAPAPPLRGDVRLEGVCLSAPERRQGGRPQMLDDVSFAVGAGERIAVMGPNGAGKSTLLQMLLRLRDPVAGSVCLDDRDLRDYTVESARRQFSTVFQEPVLFGLTVRQNIALGSSDGDLARALERAGAADLVAGLPDGLDTLVRRSGRSLSLGERQRLAVARALLRDGRLWLLDEPTSGLDPQAGVLIRDVLLEATRGRTTFWVTHDPELAAALDRVLVLGDGRVWFLGTFEELRRRVGGDVREEFLETLCPKEAP